MKVSLTLAGVLGGTFLLAGMALAQFGRPAPVPHPPPAPVRAPVVHPQAPVVPHQPPGAAPALRSHPHRVDTSAAAARGAGAVGMHGSPLGQGPLLGVVTLRAEADRFPPGVGVVVAQPQPNFQPLNQPAAPGAFGDAAFWVFPLILGVGLLAGVGAVIGLARRGATSLGRVRIIALPPGEAPEYIRQAWVGLELPVVSDQGGGVFGVLSNRPANCRDGFAVNGAIAVRILAARDPDAAAWWRTNAAHVLSGNYQLVFPAEVCERAST